MFIIIVLSLVELQIPRLLVPFFLVTYVGKSEDNVEQLVPTALNTYPRKWTTSSKASSGDGRRFELASIIG